MRLRSIVFRRASLVIALLLSIALTACGGSSGGSPSNSSSNNTSPTQPPKQETSTDDDKTSESTEHWLFTQASNQPTVFSTANGVVVEQLYSVTNLSDNDMSLDGVLLYNVANAKASQYGNDYDKIFKDPSLISQTITARASSGFAPCTAVFDRNVSSNVIPTKSSVTVCIDTLVSRGGNSITHFYNGTAIGNVTYTEVATAPSGKVGDTLVLMGKHQLNDPLYTPSSSKFTCTVNITCTGKYDLFVSPTNFLITVIHPNGVSSCYSISQGANNQVGVNPTGAISYGNSSNVTLSVSNIAIQDGDTVKVQYWPRPQASEGLLGYTEAYATWTMTYRNGSFQ